MENLQKLKEEEPNRKLKQLRKANYQKSIPNLHQLAYFSLAISSPSFSLTKIGLTKPIPSSLTILTMRSLRRKKMSRNPSKVSRQTVEETEKKEGVGKEGVINNYTEVEMSGSSVNFESMNIHGDITLVFKPHALVLIYEEKTEEILVKDVSLDPFFYFLSYLLLILCSSCPFSHSPSRQFCPSSRYYLCESESLISEDTFLFVLERRTGNETGSPRNCSDS